MTNHQGWSAERLFAGPGDTLARHRSRDWSATPLGPVDGWPVELRSAIRTVLPSRIPMLLWWGPELIQIFNEAYTRVLGDKYPDALGQPAAECWSEVWEELGPVAEGVLGTFSVAKADTAADACRAAVDVLADNRRDLPFA